MRSTSIDPSWALQCEGSSAAIDLAPDRADGLHGANPQLAGAPHVGSGRLGEAWVYVGGVRNPVGHEGPQPSPSDRVAAGLELAVGLRDRVRGEIELNGEGANGRESLPGEQVSPLDPRSDPRPYLFGDGGV
jgi:hypothetical protein